MRNVVSGSESKPKSEKSTCTCSCNDLMQNLLQTMTAQNQLMATIIDQNNELIVQNQQLIASIQDEADDAEHGYLSE